MAAGIEHRSVDSVIQAYQDYGYPNFSIWNGKRLCVVYDGDNTDEGLQTLINYLNTILAAGTQAVYMLKVYPEGVKANSGTNYNGSTTFMLSPTAMTTTAPAPGGVGSVHFIDRTGNNSQATGKEVLSRIDSLEKENQRLQKELQDAKLNQIRTDFDNRIAGLQRQYEEKEEPTWWEKGLELLKEKPDTLDRLGNILEKVISGIRRGNKNYIVEQPAGGGSMAGTTHKSPPADPAGENSENMETEEIQLTTEGALINPLLTPEERQLKKKEQGAILVERLTPLSQDQHDDLQSDCLEIIEKRVGPVTLSRMLLAVASLDNDDLNKLLNNLD